MAYDVSKDSRFQLGEKLESLGKQALEKGKVQATSAFFIEAATLFMELIRESPDGVVCTTRGDLAMRVAEFALRADCPEAGVRWIAEVLREPDRLTTCAVSELHRSLRAFVGPDHGCSYPNDSPNDAVAAAIAQLTAIHVRR